MILENDDAVEIGPSNLAWAEMSTAVLSNTGWPSFSLYLKLHFLLLVLKCWPISEGF